MESKSNRTLERVSAVKSQDGKVFVRTQSSRPGMERGFIQYMCPIPGMMISPEPKDIVQVFELDDGTPVAFFAHNKPVDVANGDYALPEIGEREFHLQMDGGTMLSFRSNQDDTYSLTLEASKKVTIDSSGPVEINADSVEVNSTNNVQIDGSGIDLGTGGTTLVQDVNVTKDVDGHVTDVTLEKTTKTKGE